MRFRSIALIVGLISLVAGCGDDAAETTAPPAASSTSTTEAVAPTTTSTQPPTTQAPATTAAPPEELVVESADGGLVVEVPPGAAAGDADISIDVLDPADWPEPFASAEQTEGTVVYQLKPDGLEFDEPVRVRRRLAASALGLEPGQIPLVTMVTTTRDGSGYEQLGRTTIVRDGDTVTVSGDLDHFSPLVTLNERQSASVTVNGKALADSPVSRSIGRTLTWGLSIDGEPSGFTPYHFDGELPIESADGSELYEAECAEEGTFPVKFKWQARVPLADDGFGLRTTPAVVGENYNPDFRFGLTTRIECKASLGTIVGSEVSGVFFAVDHPLGEVWVANEDFGEGASGMYGMMTGDFPSLHLGLIGDTDGNGILTSSDAIYPTREARLEADGAFHFTLPLDRFGSYFLWAKDTAILGDDLEPAFGSSFAEAMEAFALALMLEASPDSDFGWALAILVDDFGPVKLEVGAAEGPAYESDSAEWTGIVDLGLMIDF